MPYLIIYIIIIIDEHRTNNNNKLSPILYYLGILEGPGPISQIIGGPWGVGAYAVKCGLW